MPISSYISQADHFVRINFKIKLHGDLTFVISRFFYNSSENKVLVVQWFPRVALTVAAKGRSTK